MRPIRAGLFLVLFVSVMSCGHSTSGGGFASAPASTAPVTTAPVTTAAGQLAIVTAFALDKTSLAQGDTLDATITYENVGGAPIGVQQALVLCVPPGGLPSAFAPVASATIVQQGATLALAASRTFTTADAPGTWTAHAVWVDGNGNTNVSPDVSFVLAPAPSPFVTVDHANAGFVLNGKPFYFCGTNAYYLAQDKAHGGPNTLAALDAAQTVGLTVVRTLGCADGYQVWGTSATDSAIIQMTPGVYQASGLQALDFAISEAGKRNLHLVVVLVNNWDSFGGMDQYVQWAGLSGHDLFFTNATVKQFYKNYVHDLVTRVNSITGVAYRDDPTIMSWELANEARCDSDPGAVNGTLLAWYDEMATYLHSVDPNHLVSNGEEGVDTSPNGYSTYTSYSGVLDGSSGTSFTKNVALPGIDWGSVHLYPDTSGWTDPTSDGTNWIVDHTKIARAQGKPLVVAEYGLSPSPHSIYKTWLDVVANAGTAGAMVWELVPDSGANTVPGPTDVVYPTDAADVANQAAAAAVMNAK
jgi:mannan endo-1,4-beta-mannosidase